MRRSAMLVPIIILGTLLTAPRLHAVTIDFIPVSQETSLGHQVSVDVVIFGLDAIGEIVSAFDLDVTYDDTILRATDVLFGPSLGVPFGSDPFDPALAAVTSFDTSLPGVVDFAELSFLLDDPLHALQGDGFTLASLTFESVGLGTSPLGFVLDDFNQVVGRSAALLDIGAGTGHVTVVAAAVPAPSTGGLLVVGLIAWAARRRSRY